MKLADGVAGLSHIILRRVRNNNTAIGGIIRVWHHATIDREQSGMSMVCVAVFPAESNYN